MSSTLGRKCVMLVPDALSQNQMRSWAFRNGFDLTKSYKNETISPDDYLFHCTVMYSENAPTKPLPKKSYPIPSFNLEIESFGFIGENNNIPCLHLKKTNELLEVRNEIVFNYGLQDKWNTFKPHMTLSYNTESVPELYKISYPLFKIRIEKIVITDVNPPPIPNLLPFKQYMLKNQTFMA